jgi:hypothetical protein
MAQKVLKARSRERHPAQGVQLLTIFEVCLSFQELRMRGGGDGWGATKGGRAHEGEGDGQDRRRERKDERTDSMACVGVPLSTVIRTHKNVMQCSGQISNRIWLPDFYYFHIILPRIISTTKV